MSILWDLGEKVNQISCLHHPPKYYVKANSIRFCCNDFYGCYCAVDAVKCLQQVHCCVIVLFIVIIIVQHATNI